MSASEMTVEEMTESLTGFEEIGIQKQFGQDLMEMERTPVRMIRSLVMIDIARRDEVNHVEAYKRAMDMTMKQVMAHFADDEEPMPEEPTTESGKEDSLPA